MFGAFSVGQALSFAPDYSKAMTAAARVFDLLDTEPAIDSSSKKGQKPVGNCTMSLRFCMLPSSSLATDGRRSCCIQECPL